MRVGAWEETTHNGWRRLSARVDWEDSARDADTLWLEWPADGAAVVSAEPDAALLMTYPLAMSLGEQRLRLEGPVSPRLADGARLAVAAIERSRPELRTVRLELDERHVPWRGGAPKRDAAVCLSGGVDALAALQQNLEQVPVDHPMRFRQGLFVFGLNSFDFADGAIVASREQAVWAYGARLETFAAAVGLSLVRVRTNLRALYPSFEAWGAATHDSHLAAVAQAMRHSVHSLAIGSAGAGLSGGFVQDPLLASLYSSGLVEVYGAQHMVSRLDKMRRLLTWPEAIDVLRVCLHLEDPPPGQRNCGRCEKCLRTMLQATLLGAGESPIVRAVFTEWVTEAALDRLTMSPVHARAFYVTLGNLLAEQGRSTLADAVRRATQRALEAEVVPAAGPWHRLLRRLTG